MDGGQVDGNVVRCVARWRPGGAAGGPAGREGRRGGRRGCWAWGQRKGLARSGGRPGAGAGGSGGVPGLAAAGRGRLCGGASGACTSGPSASGAGLCVAGWSAWPAALTAAPPCTPPRSVNFVLQPRRPRSPPKATPAPQRLPPPPVRDARERERSPYARRGHSPRRDAHPNHRGDRCAAGCWGWMRCCRAGPRATGLWPRTAGRLPRALRSPASLPCLAQVTGPPCKTWLSASGPREGAAASSTPPAGQCQQRHDPRLPPGPHHADRTCAPPAAAGARRPLAAPRPAACPPRPFAALWAAARPPPAAGSRPRVAGGRLGNPHRGAPPLLPLLLLLLFWLVLHPALA
jgi:hypothetical protein